MELLTLAAAFLAGVYLGSWGDLPAIALVLFALACILLAEFLVIGRRSRLPAILVLIVILGALRGDLAGDGGALGLVAYHGQGSFQVEGVVTNDPETVGAP